MKKTALLATAIAAITAGSAMADTTVYGRARMGLLLADGNDNKGLVNDSSRFGVKGSEDLGNGMKAIYKFELGYDADDNAGSAVSNRIGMVGVQGSFGTVKMGNLWTPTYLLADGINDPFNHFGTKVSLVGRSNDALAYVNKFGSATVAVAVVASEADTTDLIDAKNIGVSFPAGPVTVGVGYHANTDDSGTSVSAAYKGKGFSASLVVSSYKDLGAGNGTSFLVTAPVGNGKVLVRAESVKDITGAADISGTTVGYWMNLSKRTQVYVENASSEVGDGTIVGLKHNF